MFLICKILNNVCLIFQYLILNQVPLCLQFFSDTPDGRTALSDSQQSSCACFITRAVELCWLMNVQDPPLVVTWSVKPGVICDNTRYKQFTHSGQFVEFLVWPPLYLFKDGHLLSKGVVQCIWGYIPSKAITINCQNTSPSCNTYHCLIIKHY